MTHYKLVVFGTPGVGKSCLTIQLAHNYFVDDYDPTIENNYRKQVTIDSEPCLLDIFESASDEGYAAMRDGIVSWGQGYFFTYSVTSRRSFAGLRDFYDHVVVRKGPDAPLVLVGNKCDLKEDRQVSVVEGQDLAISWGCPYFETSAKDNINVEESFYQLVREVRMDSQRIPPIERRERKRA